MILAQGSKPFEDAQFQNVDSCLLKVSKNSTHNLNHARFHFNDRWCTSQINHSGKGELITHQVLVDDSLVQINHWVEWELATYQVLIDEDTIDVPSITIGNIEDLHVEVGILMNRLLHIQQPTQFGHNILLMQ